MEKIWQLSDEVFKESDMQNRLLAGMLSEKVNASYSESMINCIEESYPWCVIPTYFDPRDIKAINKYKAEIDACEHTFGVLKKIYEAQFGKLGAMFEAISTVANDIAEHYIKHNVGKQAVAYGGVG